jgi:capsule polysaccharide export protein KpsC/LpsZ
MYTFQVSEWKDEIIQAMFEFAKRHISFVKEELLKEERKMEEDLKISLWGERKEVTKTLPKSGRDPHTCLEVMFQSCNSFHLYTDVINSCRCINKVSNQKGIV